MLMTDRPLIYENSANKRIYRLAGTVRPLIKVIVWRYELTQHLYHDIRYGRATRKALMD